MNKETTIINLIDLEEVSGKKSVREIVYAYSGYQFNLHKIGDDAEGKPMYRVTATNFDNMLLKKYSKKTYPAKGFSTIQSSNIKQDLMTIFDEISANQKKKALAKKKFERAQKMAEKAEEKASK